MVSIVMSGRFSSYTSLTTALVTSFDLYTPGHTEFVVIARNSRAAQTAGIYGLLRQYLTRKPDVANDAVYFSLGAAALSC